MENNNEHLKSENETTKENDLSSKPTDAQDVEFENPSVDPGFENLAPELAGREDKREGNIDANKSIKEMQENKGDDALNYNNDRENGAYNPKNI
jgi:hypothetical protein